MAWRTQILQDSLDALGISADDACDPHKLDAAYKRRARELHPDKHPEEAREEMSRKMSALNDAKDFLTNPDSFHTKEHAKGVAANGGTLRGSGVPGRPQSSGRRRPPPPAWAQK
mmetsp:Transcript_18202/g.59449  ORF Transcript_18202/g.59449 Transcript_18202/m.59449 type:complete len:114 (+) Transcript_18202:53-394(+)